MKHATKLSGILFAAAALALLAPAVSHGGVTEPMKTTVLSPGEIQVDFWSLWQHSGAELYQQMCASCHGVDASGSGPGVAHGASAPALVYLQRAGVPESHWTYMLGSACDDRRRPEGHEAMPCWQRIFRQALGNDAAPLLVDKKLVEYLASIQQ